MHRVARPQRLARTLLLAVATLLLVSSCTAAEQDRSAKGHPRPTAPAAEPDPIVPAWGSQICQSVAVTCAEHAGLPTWLLQPADAGRRAVLVDAGGPGSTLEGTVERVAALGLSPDTNVLVVGESWEVTPPRSRCLEAEARRLSTFDELRRSGCDLAEHGFSPNAYSSAVAAALEADNLELTAAVGVSFGAVRVAAGTPHEVPLVLVTPAPVRASISEIGTARSRAIRAEAQRLCPQEPRTCTAAIDGAGGALGTQLRYLEALGLLGASAQPEQFQSAITELGGRARGRESVAWRRRAYASTYRYGQGDVLPNMVSYRAGTCSVYENGAGAPADDNLALVYQEVLGCPDRVARRVRLSDQRVGCLFEGRHDLVTPRALTRTWLASSPRIRLSPRVVPQHGAVSDTVVEMIDRAPGSVENCAAGP